MVRAERETSYREVMHDRDAGVGFVRHLELLVLLGALQAFAPISIDMYLPAMPVMEKVFHTTAQSVEVTMVTFLIGFALGQILYGPITDRFGRKPCCKPSPGWTWPPA